MQALRLSMLERLTLALYGLLVWAVQPLLRRKLQRRAQAEPAYGQHIPERFGFYAADLDSLWHPSANDPRECLVWVHAVSLGETRAAAILVNALRAELPGMRLLLTHSTATGRAEGAKLLYPGDLQVWLPWDTRAAVNRFLQRFRPQMGVLMETEVWPQLVAACHRHGVPLALANARLNEKSWRNALRWRELARPAYAGLSAVWAQTEADAQRLHDVGAPKPLVLGNIKFDVQPDAAQCALGKSWRSALGRPVVMFASSREGEETLFLQEIKQKYAYALENKALIATKNVANASAVMPQVLWLIVPRHPQRFDEVERLLVAQGLRVSRRSTWGSAGPVGADADVLLGDTLGDMALYYSLADMALLGGSFAPLGGQNLIEAAACACPVVAGPHTFNFAQATEQACAAGAAQRVPDMAQAITAACTLAQQPQALAQARSAATAFAERHKGTARATAQAVVGLLGV